MENKAAFKIAARLFTHCLPAVCEKPKKEEKNKKTKTRVGCFPIHLLFCVISSAFLFSFESVEKLRGAQVSSSVSLVSGARKLSNGGDDLR